MARCQERAGFLFAHDCDEPVSERCGTCNKAVCKAHAHPGAGGLLCSSCAKVAARRAPHDPGQIGQAQQRQANREDRRTPRREHQAYHDDSPYLYGGAYYGYGHYGHGYWGSDHMNRSDFTEADGSSLSGGSGEGFEDDVGGS